MVTVSGLDFHSEGFWSKNIWCHSWKRLYSLLTPLPIGYSSVSPLQALRARKRPKTTCVEQDGRDCSMIAIKRYGMVQSSMRSWLNRIKLFLKLSFKYCLMNEFEIFKKIGLKGLKQTLNRIGGNFNLAYAWCGVSLSVSTQTRL